MNRKEHFYVRARRWVKFFGQYVDEKLHGLDFSLFYVGDEHRQVEEFHGYSMTDPGAMKKMLLEVPVRPEEAAFLDVGCGKGMCMRCAKESGYGKVAGLDLDEHLLSIAKRNMEKLKLDVACIQANAAEFDGYGDYDVFYFYNPFGRPVFHAVVEKLIESQKARNRDIWVIYYHPVYGEEFETAGFQTVKDLPDSTRETFTRYYLYPARTETV